VEAQVARAAAWGGASETRRGVTGRNGDSQRSGRAFVQLNLLLQAQSARVCVQLRAPRQSKG